MDQADAAHHRRLRPEIDGLAADIDVAVVERLQHLRQGQAVVDQLVQVDGDVIGLGLAAPAGDVDHARHRLEAALQNPVLDRLQVGHRIAGRADDAVAVDLADRAFRARSAAARRSGSGDSCDSRLITHCSASS